MDIESKREYLSHYRLWQVKIRRMNDMLKACPEKSEIYQNEIEQCRRERDRIEQSIDAVDGGILSEILSQKYICGRTLEEIAFMIGYCKRQTERLHLKALERLCIG